MSINITSLQARSTEQTESRFKYKDIVFDLVEDERPNTDSLYSKVTNTDIRYTVDEGAIMNSIKNIFTTKPGEKLLNPTFGLDLSRWLFEPIDEFRAQEIGETIYSGIERYEPRVTLKNVTVLTDPENNAYRITMAILIPKLNINTSLDAVLNSPGFDFITRTKD
jgi:phage baseplate assembly protein W